MIATNSVILKGNGHREPDLSKIRRVTNWVPQLKEEEIRSWKADPTASVKEICGSFLLLSQSEVYCHRASYLWCWSRLKGLLKLESLMRTMRTFFFFFKAKSFPPGGKKCCLFIKGHSHPLFCKLSVISPNGRAKGNASKIGN